MTRQRARANGEGSIYPYRNGRWAGQCYVTETSGRRVRRTVYGSSRREVQKKVDELLEREDAGRPFAPLELTVGEFLREWLDQIVIQRVRANSLSAYRFQAERYLIPDIGAKRLHSLSARELRLYFESLRRREIGARTIVYVHSTLRAALEDAVREELIDRNPAKLVRVPRPERIEPEPLSVAEVRKLFHYVRDDRLFAMFLVFALLGLRRSEVLGLMWSDVDLEGGTLQVRRGLQRVDGQIVTSEPKTRRSRRTVPLPSVVIDALQEHRDRQDGERRQLAEKWPESQFVFTTPIGTPIDPRNCTRVVQNACEQATGRRVRLHDFRHGCVSVLLGLGVPPRTAMEIVGHSTIEMTMNVYGHVSLDEMRTALDRVGELFGEENGS